MMRAGASCSQSASTGQGCTSAEHAVHRRASMQWLAPRHAMSTQAPRFEFIPASAAKSTRPIILCGATSWPWGSTRPLLTPLRRFHLAAGLSRGEMERFGIETRGVYETPWFAYHGPAGEFLLLK